jgi:CDP-diacylglycerol---glycerol-3-phosphate 3-phosphatidyltransferase
VNLPNAITMGRIVASPLVAWLPFNPSWPLRLVAFGLFLAVAVSDYYDGRLARSRNMVTDLGKQLDPLADKLFLVATFIPMYLLMEVARARLPAAGAGDLAQSPGFAALGTFPFVTPFGIVGLPLWIIAVILGREAVMTIFREIASRRGVVIAAIRSAKLKTVFQLIWVGAAYFWFFGATAAARFGWDGDAWTVYAFLIGVIGVAGMAAAVVLTFYSLGVYLRRYGYLLLPGRPQASKQ